MEEEFENFMQRVDEVSSIVKGLSSKNVNETEKASRRADIYLHSTSDEHIDGTTIKVKNDRTLINKKAFEADTSGGNDAMSQEAFMAQVEQDAKARAADRKERKALSDCYKRDANAAFRRKDYEQALHLYDQAIAQTKDSCVLYTNRALTCLNLEDYTRVIDDCDWALKLNENSLKALLYRARARQCLKEYSLAEADILEAVKRHPDDQEFIQEYARL